MTSRQAENCRGLIYRGFTGCKNHDGLSVSKGNLRGVLIVSIFAVAVVLAICKNASGTEAVNSSVNFKNPDAVQAVLSGKETVANAAWWGFDENDSTDAIQEAINSGAAKVIIPYVGKEWIVRPIKLVSNQEIFFEPGVVVMAKKGEFKGKFDCLFSVSGASNITLRGYGATLRMRRKDYKSSAYTKSEHRHTVEFRGCDNINILGLRLEYSGGDGIFIAAAIKRPWQPCRNVLIRDCICNCNYRQGISVISVDKMLVENCLLKKTRGTLPAAGIDLEPSRPAHRLSNVVISNCVAEGNNGGGFVASISKLKAGSREVSVLFVNCYARNCVSAGLVVYAKGETGPKGLIEFKNCISENITYDGARVLWEKDSSTKLRFDGCKFQNVAKKPNTYPIKLVLRREEVVSQTGGIEFLNCYVYDNVNRPFLKIADAGDETGIYDVKGEINVHNPHGVKVNTGIRDEKLPLKVRVLGDEKR